MQTIYFKKEENKNVTVRDSGNNTIIFSLQPNQNIFKDSYSNNLFFIKSTNSNPNEKGTVINCNDVNVTMCDPQILQGSDNLRNAIIVALTNIFFFIKATNSTTNPTDISDLENNSNDKFLRETDLDLDFLLTYNISKL